ncbi:7TM chemoreceptor [Ancylostoma caninum]|uniref:7TM chemoreceptor n=1 Tax=Ancylostoma caninum TaxID=29170 RepID=A0A368FDH6_ANCCA|nr:7TM chemoreceptor [Ancylostoma caninum]
MNDYVYTKHSCTEIANFCDGCVINDDRLSPRVSSFAPYSNESSLRYLLIAEDLFGAKASKNTNPIEEIFSTSAAMTECVNLDASPRAYIISMNVMSFLSPIVNLFTIFCILCKSTKPMSAFKWYLLIYQVTSSIFDFMYTTVTLPVIFFPLPMGFTASWMAEWFSITVHTTFIIVIPSFPCVATCIFGLFAYRIHLIIPHNHFLKISENGHIHATVVFFFVYTTPTIIALVNSSPDQSSARQLVLSVGRFNVYETTIL